MTDNLFLDSFADIDWQGQYPNLGKLYAKLMQRPSFADTVPKD